MYLVFADRDLLLECLPKGGCAAELGVYTGEHAATMLATIGCDELHLIDYWRFEPRDHIPFADTPDHFAELVRITEQYMGKDPNRTLEQAYRDTVERFADDRRVHVHRERTSVAVKQFVDGFFDLIYVDANHQYEGVMRDLLEYAPKLRRGGLMILNDHYDAPQGRKQNLGIVGSVAAFVKRSDFRYLAMTARPWSDLVIGNDLSSPYCREFVDNLLRRQTEIVELPDAIVPNYTHKKVTFADGSERDLPSF